MATGSGIGNIWTAAPAATYITALTQAGVLCHTVASAGGAVNIQLHCPFCVGRGESADTRFRLGITPSGLGQCFNCGWKSRHAWEALFRKLRIDARNLLATGADAETTKDSISIPIGFQPLWGGLVSDMDKRAREYLRGRGVGSAQIRRYQIGVVWTGKFAHRVVVPWWGSGGQLITLVARDITGWQQPKYLSGGIKSLVGAPRRFDTVHLFEGVFKALRAELVLPEPTAAMLGSQLTQYQLDQLLAAGCASVYLWPDPDRPGCVGAERTARRLSELGITVRFAVMDKPADDATRAEIQSGYSHAAKSSAAGGSAWAENMRLPLYAR